MIRLVDDQQLGRVLRDSDRRVGTPEAAVYTTGYWYVRLCRAVLASNARDGVLSSPFTSLPEALRDRAIRSLLELPDHIYLVSMRDLGPLIGQLRSRHQLNILGMEAVAAAVHLSGLGAEEVVVELSARSPLLEAALHAEGVEARIV